METSGKVFPWLASCVLLAGGGNLASAAPNWPSFRGTLATGLSDSGETPTSWEVEKGENILWKTPIPGLGHSSPIIWGNRLFVTSAINQKKTAPLKVGLYGDPTAADDSETQLWKVFCLDRRSGKILWEKVSHEGPPKVQRHPKATHANCTAATDGTNLVVFFGSEGLFCYDLEGHLRWPLHPLAFAVELQRLSVSHGLSEMARVGIEDIRRPFARP